MTNAGLPIPPGFTITTEACNDYFAAGEQLPDGLWDDVLEAVKRGRARAPARASATPANPLLVSVRSGAKFSMPGMMDTVLNLGPQRGRRSTGLIALTGNERFGWDAYRRFIQMFGRIVMEVAGERFDHALEAAKARARRDAGHRPRRRRAAATLVGEFKAHRQGRHRPRLPRATRTSSSTSRSRPSSPRGSASAPATTARTRRSPHDLGTAVNVVTMVFGNMGDDSGTGVAFTRDPNTGEKVLFGEYLTNAQGEDVVAGIRTAAEDRPDGRPTCPRSTPSSSASASSSSSTTATSRTSSSRSSAAACTCSRRARAKRTAAAAVRIAADMVDEGIITKEEAIARIEPAHVDQLLRDQFDPAAPGQRPRASPRASTPRRARPSGGPSSTPTPRSSGSSRGEKVVLVRDRDLARRLPRHGRRPGHPHRPRRRDLARRGRRPPDRQAVRRRLRRARHRLRRARPPRSTDTGASVRRGRLDQRSTARPARSTSARCPTVSARFEDQPELQKVLGWADEIRRMGVWTNADKPEEAAQARSYGAQGIGLCRTEHMFREGERLEIVRGAILVANVATRAKARAAAGETLDADDAGGGRPASTPRWPSSRSSSRATSRASSRRWTACRSSSA